MRVVTLILGVLVAIAGIYCCISPISTQVSIAGMFVIVMAVGMLIGGVGEILHWNEARQFGMSSGWTLFGGVVSVVLGVVLLGCDFFASGMVYATFCAYFMCIWLIAGGISRIGAALSMRRLDNALVGYAPGTSRGWLFVLVMGVLMIVAGVCCFGSPMVLIGLMGVVFGASMVVAGVSLISLGLAMPSR